MLVCFLTDQEKNYLSDCEQPIRIRIYETFNMVGVQVLGVKTEAELKESDIHRVKQSCQLAFSTWTHSLGDAAASI